MKQFTNALKRHNTLFMWGFLIFAAFVVFVPTSLWIEDTHISVSDAQQGDPIEIEYDGRVVRDFVGNYGVVVRNTATGQIVCEVHGGPLLFVTDSARPDPLTMAWWIANDARCYGMNIPAGSYTMSTCWSIHAIFGEWVSPLSKTHCIHTKEPFHIYPAG